MVDMLQFIVFRWIDVVGYGGHLSSSVFTPWLISVILVLQEPLLIGFSARFVINQARTPLPNNEPTDIGNSILEPCLEPRRDAVLPSAWRTPWHRWLPWAGANLSIALCSSVIGDIQHSVLKSLASANAMVPIYGHKSKCGLFPAGM